MKHFKRFLMLCLAMVMCSLIIIPAFAANDNGVTYTATIDNPTLVVSSEDQIIAVTIKTNKPVDIDSIDITVGLPSGWAYVSVTNTDLGFATGDFFAATGKLVWSYQYDQETDNITTDLLAVVTYKVPANTPAGEYEISFEIVNITSDWGTPWESGTTVSTTLTIKEAAPTCDHVDKNYTYEPNNNGTHKVKCECGEYKTESEACSGTDDGDCTTAVTCACTNVVTAANASHTPATDDGDCTTAVKCVNCDQIATAAKTHVDGDDKNHVCDNDGCNVDNITEHGTGSGFRYTNDGANTNTHTKYCNDCDQAIEDEKNVACTDAAGDNNHACDANCGNTSVTDHTGGTATCNVKATCSECGAEYGNKDGNNHVGGFKYSYNIGTSRTHIVHCNGCNTNIGVENCTPRYTSNNSKTHMVDCKICGTRLGVEDHKYDETTHICACGATNHTASRYETTATTHQAYCSCGAKVGSELGHYGDKTPCTDMKECETCGYAYSKAADHGLTNGYYGVSLNNGRHHEYCADCRDKLIRGNQSCDFSLENGKCTLCGYCYHSSTFSYSSNNNGTHNVICDVCNAITKENVVCSGTATCTAKAVCSDCGAEHGWYDYNNHSSEETYFDNIYSETHTVKYKCCQRTYLDKVPHDYTQNEEHKCACGTVEPANLILNYNGGYVEKPSVTTVTLLSEYNTTIDNFQNWLNPVNEGKNLVGWNTKADGTGEDVVLEPGYLCLKTITVYAQWECNHADAYHRLTTTYTANEGEKHTKVVTCDCDTIVYTETVEHNFNNAEHKCICGAVQKYWFNVKYNGGVVVSGNTYLGFGVQTDYNKTPNITGHSMNPTREGYRLTGWNTEADGTGEVLNNFETFVMPDHDVTIYAQWECTHDANDHDLTTTYTDNEGETHTKVVTCECGDVVSTVDETHDYRNREFTCVCGKVKVFNLTLKVVHFSGEGVENYNIVIPVPYGAPLKDYIPENCGEQYNFAPIYKYGDTVNVEGRVYDGTFTVTEWFGGASAGYFDPYEATMAGGHWTIMQTSSFNGWYHDYYDGTLDQFLPERIGSVYYDENYHELEGWQEVDGAWYYFQYNAAQYKHYRVEGLTRVPYPEESKGIMSDLAYERLAEDIAYAASKNIPFIDAEKAWFVFGEDGKLQQTTGVIVVIVDNNEVERYVVDGCIAWHVGMVKVDGEYYYFGGDSDNGGNKKVTGRVYATRDFNSGLPMNGTIYYFDENGDMVTTKDVEVKANPEDENKLYYYVNGYVTYGAGLVKIGDDYYYARSNGQVATGTYYITNTNGITGFTSGQKLIFGADGKLQAIKNGIVDGYYYVNNHIQYGAGLIEIDGDIYYVRSNGQVATGKYYITNTNGREGFVEGEAYMFDENGKYYTVELKNGIVEEKVEGETVYCYYVNDIKQYGLGLIEIDGDIYYVRSNGQVATGTYYITTTNDIEGFESGKPYDFGTDGKHVTK